MTLFRKYVIVAAGAFPHTQYPLSLLKRGDVVVCCDSAFRETLKHRTPDYIVGDMDSTTQEEKELFKEIIFSESEQEYNDLTKAVRFVLRIAQQRGEIPHITILGATGKREDHTVGNISLLMMYLDMLPNGGKVEMITDHGRFIPLLGDNSVWVGKGSVVSIFGADEKLKLHTSGVQYPTDNVIFDGWSWWKATLNTATEDIITLMMNHPSKVLIFVGFNE